MEFQRVIRSPNGEDVLYIFHQRDEGQSGSLFRRRAPASARASSRRSSTISIVLAMSGAPQLLAIILIAQAWDPQSHSCAANHP